MSFVTPVEMLKRPMAIPARLSIWLLLILIATDPSCFVKPLMFNKIVYCIFVTQYCEILTETLYCKMKQKNYSCTNIYQVQRDVKSIWNSIVDYPTIRLLFELPAAIGC